MNPLFLAQVSLDSVPALIQWIIGGSMTIFLINQVLAFYKDHIRETPAPANTYATKDELSDIETSFKDSLQNLSNDFKAEVDSQAFKRKKIYENVEALGRDMAGLKADNHTQTRQLHNLENKIDRLLERPSNRA